MYQQLIISGYLGQDPELRSTPDGTPVCNFSVAVNRAWTDDTDTRQQETTWYRVTTWQRQAEICDQYLKKGDPVLIVAERVKTQAWIDRDGTPRASIEVTPGTIRFLGGPAAAAGLAGAVPPSTPADEESTASEDDAVEDDDIPF